MTLISMSDRFCLNGCGARYRPGTTGTCTRMVSRDGGTPEVCGGPTLEVLVEWPPGSGIDATPVKPTEGRR